MPKSKNKCQWCLCRNGHYCIPNKAIVRIQVVEEWELCEECSQLPIFEHAKVIRTLITEPLESDVTDEILEVSSAQILPYSQRYK